MAAETRLNSSHSDISHAEPSSLAPPLIGHERRFAALVNAFEKGVVPQTLLVSGARHVGKTTFAKRYAQLLLCPNVGASSTRSAPCLRCKTCHQIEIEVFPDFKIYRPVVGAGKDAITAPESLDSSVFTIEQARDFADEAMYRPTLGARKIMIIAQADRMTIPAQQSLLKNFEEPGAGVHIVLLVENARLLLPTILSRCWHLPLSPAPDAALRQWIFANFDESSNSEMPNVEEVLRVARGLPGAAWREIKRLEMAEHGEPTRSAQMDEFIARIGRSQAVGAFALTESALQIADKWGDEDERVALQIEHYEAKKVDKKLTRSRAAAFLDELSHAYWRRWQNAAVNAQNSDISGKSSTRNAAVWADGLDQIRKTRHYILRNANTNLALDVLFGRLIGAAQPAQTSGQKAQMNSMSQSSSRRF